MFGLLALAFVLPKFVQNAAPEDGSIFSPSVETPSVPKPAKIVAPVNIPKIVSSVNPIQREDVNYDKLIPPFLSSVRDGEFDQANQMLGLLKDAIPSAVHSSLEYSLETAKGAHSAKLKFAEEKKVYEQKLLAAQKGIKDAKVAITDVLSNPGVIQTSSDNSPSEKLAPTLPKVPSLETPEIPSIDSLPKPAMKPEETKIAKLPEVPALDETKAASTQLNLPSDISVNFGFNSSEVPYYFYGSLDQIAEKLKNESRLAVELRGYSDSVGNAEYNKILSETRSNQIRVNLISRGVSEDQIQVKTFGSSVSPSGRSANHRRVDVVFYER